MYCNAAILNTKNAMEKLIGYLMIHFGYKKWEAEDLISCIKDQMYYGEDISVILRERQIPQKFIKSFED